MKISFSPEPLRWVHVAFTQLRADFFPQDEYEEPENTGLDGFGQWEATKRREKATVTGVHLHRCAELCAASTACDTFFYKDDEGACEVSFTRVLTKSSEYIYKFETFFFKEKYSAGKSEAVKNNLTISRPIFSFSFPFLKYFSNVALKPLPWTKFAEHNFGSEPWSAFVLVCSEGNESPLPILGTYFKPPPPWTQDGNTMTSAYVAPAGQVKFFYHNEKSL